MTEAVELALAFGAGFIASAVNAVAGGGSLISFPLLTAGTGLTSKLANATNSVGLWPGSLAGALGFWPKMQQTWPRLRPLILPTLIGSLCGAILLIVTPSRVFDIVIPFLVLFAVGLLAWQKQIKEWTERCGIRIGKGAMAIIQFLVAVYGGYFGAGMGIMMLAAFSLYVDGSIHDHNAVKNWLAMIINLSITGVFLYKGLVVGIIAVPMIIGAILGGYTSARLSQRIHPDVLRRWIVTYGLISVLWFVWRIFAPVPG